MNGKDWGADPQVRYLREVFAHSETVQKALLDKTSVSPFDDRLRRWRENALKLFENVWELSAGRGVSMKKEEISKIYLYCLAHFLKLNRIAVPPEVLPPDESIERLIKEVLR